MQAFRNIHLLNKKMLEKMHYQTVQKMEWFHSEGSVSSASYIWTSSRSNIFGETLFLRNQEWMCASSFEKLTRILHVLRQSSQPYKAWDRLVKTSLTIRVTTHLGCFHECLSYTKARIPLHAQHLTDEKVRLSFKLSHIISGMKIPSEIFWKVQ